jgi:S-DNA-T family DNA segregation ATPase FtsK/SpoIIIE
VRAATGGAKDLDPAHRRDGIGLLLLVAALITAGGAWWQAGSAGDAISDGLRWAFGRARCCCPCCACSAPGGCCATPRARAGRGRLAIGWAAWGSVRFGVLHVLARSPCRPQRAAGGLTGFLLASRWPTCSRPWLACRAGAAGRLRRAGVVTANPLHQVPQGLSLLRDRCCAGRPS